jgi:hypothetical protein
MRRVPTGAPRPHLVHDENTPNTKGNLVPDDPMPGGASAPSGFIDRAVASVADALRYWEPKRAIYNLVLAVVVIADTLSQWSVVSAKLTTNTVLGLFVLAVLANVCYCAVYVVDLFVQFSGLRAAWARGRVAVLIIGTAFAAIITHFFVQEFFGGIG